MNLNKKFFLRPPIEVARDLLGAKLTTQNKQGITSGIIVEVEAYGAKDEASHSFRGQTERNKLMFAEGGYCYVYLIYGMHHCVNVVTESKGIGSAVLIRALEPLEGSDLMMKRRATKRSKDLTSGPAKLCQALGITKRQNGENLLSSTEIWLTKSSKIHDSEVSFSRRVGISKAKDLEWRIFLKDSDYVSKTPLL